MILKRRQKKVYFLVFVSGLTRSSFLQETFRDEMDAHKTGLSKEKSS